MIDYQSSEDESYEPLIEEMEEDAAVRLHADEWLNSLHKGDIMFHCEFNPIERCWGHSKRYTRVYTNYTFPNLRKNIPLVLDTVTIENIKN